MYLLMLSTWGKTSGDSVSRSRVEEDAKWVYFILEEWGCIAFETAVKITESMVRGILFPRAKLGRTGGSA